MRPLAYVCFAAAFVFAACAVFSNGTGPRLCSDYCPPTSGCVGGVCEPLEGAPRPRDAGHE